MSKRRLTPAKSRPHMAVRKILKELFPGFRILEEQPIDVGGYRPLMIDFLLPDLKVAIEVQGRQHDEFVPHFHQTVGGFRKQQGRDKQKANAIEMAGYALIEIRESELTEMTTTELAARITKAHEELK
jgi:very-short-patch-repair endonuclease